MGTLGQMKSRIADDLARSDLTTQIGEAIQSAIKHAESERFWFNVTRTITFNTVASQAVYTSSDNALIPYLVRIDEIYYTQVSSSSIYPLDYYDPDEFEILESGSSPSGGRPTCYTYAEGVLRLWPTPNDVYSIRVHAHYKLTALTDDSQSNAWTTEAEELIRTMSKERVYRHIIRNSIAADEMALLLPAGLRCMNVGDMLRSETSSRGTRGRIMPVDF